MDSHSLVKLAHVLHGVHSAIIDGERRLIETLGYLAPSILRAKGDLET